MTGDLRRWGDDYVNELCDIVFGQWMLGYALVHAFPKGVLLGQRCSLWAKVWVASGGSDKGAGPDEGASPSYTAIRHLQISSNTPALNSNEERALEDELAIDVAPIHLDNDYYTPNLDSIPRTTEETDGDNVEYEGNSVVLPSSGNNGASTSTANQRHVVEMSEASKRRMVHKRDDITDAMWADYVAYRN
nr:hypothetical protein CFP56_60901 [Quercus suber]